MNMNMLILFFLFIFIYYNEASSLQCDSIQNENRFDCFPESGADASACSLRGCCWNKPNQVAKNNLKERNAVPYCFFPSNFPEYELIDSQITANKYVYSIQKNASTFRQNEILKLEVRLELESNERLHVQIVDPNKKRYQVPLANLNQKTKQNLQDTDFQIYIGKSPFSIKIYRKSSGRIIFDTSVAPLIYADQYIQFSTMLVNDHFYGIGEHRDALAHDTNWNSYTMWNRLVFRTSYQDILFHSQLKIKILKLKRDYPPSTDVNLYGTHPFYIGKRIFFVILLF